MAGIDTELRMREMAAGGNPQAAQQRYAQSKSLMDLLVAQKVSNDYASARNAMQAATQAPAGTVKDQLDMSNEQVTRNDMMRSIMPGVQMKAARDSQAMQRRNMGVPTQPAPNIRMADGGIVGYEDGGIIDRILNFFRRNPEDAPDAEEVRRVMSEYGLDSGYANPNLRRIGRTPRDTVGNRNMGFMAAMPELPEPPRKRTAEAGPPTRAEKFSQMFPKAREAVNRGDGSTMGGLQYLQMVGRKQQEAKEEEARRAANYIKMLARSQDMIDEVDPANTLPPEIAFFDNGGGVSSNVGRAYLDPETGEPLGLGARISRLFSGITGGLEKDELYQNPDAMTREELNNFPSEKEIREARYNVPEEERLTAQQLNAMTREEGRHRLIDRALKRRGTPETTSELTDPFGVRGIVDRLGEPEFRMQGIERDAEPTDKQKLGSMVGSPIATFKEGELPEKKGIFDDVDIGRLQAFLAGGAGQRSTAEALGGGLRGLMAEDQRRQTLASDEAIEAAKIAAERYGAQLDYDAALAGMDADLRDLVTKAELDAIQSFDEDKRKLARESLADIRGGLDEQFNNAVMLLRDQYENDPEALARELNAATNEALKRRVRIATEAGGGATGTFSTNIEDVAE